MKVSPPSVVALGEVLWDLFPEGARFGGAPANFACHAAALGADVSLVSCVGSDELGQQALSALEDHDVKTDYVSRDATRPTGTVQVELNEAGIPSYTIAEDVAWDHLQSSSKLGQLATRIDAVCFGTLGQRGRASREVIRSFVAAAPARALRVFDVNLRAPFFDAELIRQSLEPATVFKLSDEELETVAEACALNGSTDELLAALMAKYALDVIAFTRGPLGARLIGRNETSDFSGVKTKVADTVGAGDAFTAALTIGLLRGESLESINRHACAVAAYVCAQAGATPALPPELKSNVSQYV